MLVLAVRGLLLVGERRGLQPVRRGGQRPPDGARAHRAFVTGALPARPWLVRADRGAARAVGRRGVVALNVWAALYTFLGAFTYAVVYTVWLKRRTWLNIVVGGLAGSFAVLAGATAVDPSPGALPLLALVLFLWTPPHFWSLAIANRDDYAAAGVPMLPVVVGTERAAWAVFWSTVALVAASLLPGPVRRRAFCTWRGAAGGAPSCRRGSSHGSRAARRRWRRSSLARAAGAWCSAPRGVDPLLVVVAPCPAPGRAGRAAGPGGSAGPRVRRCWLGAPTRRRRCRPPPRARCAKTASRRRFPTSRCSTAKAGRCASPSYRGKPLLVNFIYTGCFQVCPTSTRAQARRSRRCAAASTGGSTSSASASTSLPTRQQAMKAFALQHRISAPNWEFLSAPACTVARWRGRSASRSIADAGRVRPPAVRSGSSTPRAASCARCTATTSAPTARARPAAPAARAQPVPPQLGLAEIVDRVRVLHARYYPVSGTYRVSYALAFEIAGGVTFAIAMLVLRPRWRERWWGVDERSPAARALFAAGTRATQGAPVTRGCSPDSPRARPAGSARAEAGRRRRSARRRQPLRHLGALGFCASGADRGVGHRALRGGSTGVRRLPLDRRWSHQPWYLGGWLQACTATPPTVRRLRWDAPGARVAATGVLPGFRRFSWSPVCRCCCSSSPARSGFLVELGPARQFSASRPPNGSTRCRCSPRR